ncbi:MAG: TfoX/Sxy family protein [Candidatus Margulisbacteria bacterium]|nr:TfoX/Sxy family protein [Candidatus Margulisiibacteriota bacterium]
MVTDSDFIQYLEEQLADTNNVFFRKMFGEYAIYCDEKVVALVCDNQLFIKPTVAGREYLEEVIEEPPYIGSKNYFLIGDRLEDREWLSELVRITANELPLPKPKKPKKKN